MHQQIRKYLQGGSFLQGLNCYRATGGPNVLEMERYLNGHFVPQDAINRLDQYLINWMELHQEKQSLEEQSVEEPPQKEHSSKPVLKTPKPTPQTQEPESIQNLRAKGRKLLKIQADLHSQLKVVQDEEERYELAHEIMSKVIPQIDQIYSQIRNYEATGDLPAIEQTVDAFMEGVNIMLRRSSLKSRISQIRRQLKKQIDPAKEQELQKELLDKEVELKEINRKTGLDSD